MRSFIPLFVLFLLSGCVHRLPKPPSFHSLSELLAYRGEAMPVLGGEKCASILQFDFTDTDFSSIRESPTDPTDVTVSYQFHADLVDIPYGGRSGRERPPDMTPSFPGLPSPYMFFDQRQQIDANGDVRGYVQIQRNERIVSTCLHAVVPMAGSTPPGGPPALFLTVSAVHEGPALPGDVPPPAPVWNNGEDSTGMPPSVYWFDDAGVALPLLHKSTYNLVRLVKSLSGWCYEKDTGLLTQCLIPFNFTVRIIGPYPSDEATQ
jgi:hypothetical protein